VDTHTHKRSGEFSRCHVDAVIFAGRFAARL